VLLILERIGTAYEPGALKKLRNEQGSTPMMNDPRALDPQYRPPAVENSQFGEVQPARASIGIGGVIFVVLLIVGAVILSMGSFETNTASNQPPSTVGQGMRSKAPAATRPLPAPAPSSSATPDTQAAPAAPKE